MALSFQAARNLGMVVDLAVVYDLDAPVVAGHGLLARRRVHDTQPTVTKTNASLHVESRAIRTPMRHDIAHALDRRSLNFSARTR